MDHFNNVTTAYPRNFIKSLAKMRHVKRMVLVPEDFLSRLERPNKQETSPIVKGLVHLDENLDRILTGTNLADSDKQKLYHTNLEHYMGLKDQKNS